MTIVCGTDFSTHSARAVAVAGVLAARWNDAVQVVHVREGASTRERMTAEHADLMRSLHAGLKEAAESLRALGLSVSEAMLVGVPDEELVARAQREAARLIVVGALGRRTATKWLLGSVAERTAEAAGVPVLVARGEDGFLEWSRGERPLRVVVGADFSAPTTAALRWVGELCRDGGCTVVVAHIYRPAEEARRFGVSPSAGADNDLEIEGVLRRDLDVVIAAQLGTVPVSVRVEAGQETVAEDLVRIAAQEGADLLVVGTRQQAPITRLWHGAVSYGVLHAAPMSVACVPASPTLLEPTIPVLQRVLVATDLSALGNRAVAYAYAMLRAGGVVHLLHVVEADTADAAVRLRALVPAEASARGIATEIEVADGGSAAEVIEQVAARHGVDLICLGSHGGAGVVATMCGSVAAAVLLHSDRPVLLVRPSKR